jgi:hypothetical protein
VGHCVETTRGMRGAPPCSIPVPTRCRQRRHHCCTLREFTLTVHSLSELLVRDESRQTGSPHCAWYACMVHTHVWTARGQQGASCRQAASRDAGQIGLCQPPPTPPNCGLKTGPAAAGSTRDHWRMVQGRTRTLCVCRCSRKRAPTSLAGSGLSPLKSRCLLMTMCCVPA